MRVITLVSMLLWASLTQGGQVADAVRAADRPDADVARDAGRRPAEVVEFLGVQPGMTAIDLLAASGYYTEVLAHAVGPKGNVYAHNTAGMLQFRNGANEKAISTRLAKNRLPNVERLNAEVPQIGLAAGSVDVAITALNFHDIYNGAGEAQALEFLRVVHGLLKPGGVLGLIEHSGAAGADNARLHRLNEEAARAVIAKSGFRVADTSHLLRNPNDDLTKGVFANRGKTDRFLLKLVKD